jgi:hypothetical protein
VWSGKPDRERLASSDEPFTTTVAVITLALLWGSPDQGGGGKPGSGPKGGASQTVVAVRYGSAQDATRNGPRSGVLVGGLAPGQGEGHKWQAKQK